VKKEILKTVAIVILGLFGLIQTCRLHEWKGVAGGILSYHIRGTVDYASVETPEELQDAIEDLRHECDYYSRRTSELEAKYHITHHFHGGGGK